MSSDNKPNQPLQPKNLEQHPCIESKTLFANHRQLFIQHESEIYTLRITSRGKLILTK